MYYVLCIMVWYYGTFCSLSVGNPFRFVPQTAAHGRQLQQTTVSDVAGFIAALANASIGHIYIGAGDYFLTSQLSISRDLILEAAQPGTVVLDGQGSTRVLTISSGTVNLIGLNITGGYVNSEDNDYPVRNPESVHRPDG